MTSEISVLSSFVKKSRLTKRSSEIKEEGHKKVKKNKQELILKVGAAGGSLSLWSVSAKDGTRSFVVKTDESTLKGMMSEEDAEGLAFKSETAPLHSFADAMIALGHYSWHLLSPMFVHQDFKEPVLRAVMNLGGEKLANRWQQKLNVGSSDILLNRSRTVKF